MPEAVMRTKTRIVSRHSLVPTASGVLVGAYTPTPPSRLISNAGPTIACDEVGTNLFPFHRDGVQQFISYRFESPLFCRTLLFGIEDAASLSVRQSASIKGARQIFLTLFQFRNGKQE